MRLEREAQAFRQSAQRDPPAAGLWAAKVTFASPARRAASSTLTTD
jgi:hypothetical protein